MLQSPGTLKISVTDKAAEKVKAAMEKQGKHDAGLRQQQKLAVAGTPSNPSRN